VSGLLSVPAWGANTMRTEFAVLTGIGDQALGAHRFNPYRRVARGGILALPHRLRALGYKTVCIHPYTVGFFGRDSVFPTLGFDRFIDIDGLPNAPHEGPYVADGAVARNIAEVLGAADRPTFVFAITMENHGPLHLERVSPADMARLYRDPPPPGWDDLTLYLRHLANADRMFGDHVPSMSRVYADQGFCDSRTDYLIWPAVSAPRGRVDLGAHQLPELLLAALTVAGPPAPGPDQR
jgi:phosphoglycerol transferase MdoB-like AlkP superfamily enzyme